MPAYADINLTCRDCGAPFVFTVGEQEFHASKGFTNTPSRCPDCRKARKAEQGGGYSSGGSRDYSSGGGGGYRSGGGYSSGGGGGYDRAPRQMYDAVCAQCGKDTKVPFQPTGSKPVYCSDCFQSQRSSYR